MIGIDKNKIANALLNVQEQPKNKALEGYIQKIMDERLKEETTINWENAHTYTGTSTNTNSSWSISTANISSTDAFKEPVKKVEKRRTKTDEIMDFFSKPEEEKPAGWFDFPTTTLHDLVSVQQTSIPSDTIYHLKYIQRAGEIKIQEKIEEAQKQIYNALKVPVKYMTGVDDKILRSYV